MDNLKARSLAVKYAVRYIKYNRIEVEETDGTIIMHSDELLEVAEKIYKFIHIGVVSKMHGGNSVEDESIVPVNNFNTMVN